MSRLGLSCRMRCVSAGLGRRGNRCLSHGGRSGGGGGGMTHKRRPFKRTNKQPCTAGSPAPCRPARTTNPQRGRSAAASQPHRSHTAATQQPHRRNILSALRRHCVGTASVHAWNTPVIFSNDNVSTQLLPAGILATMRSDVVSSSICSHGRKWATALYEPGEPGISCTSILAAASRYSAFASASPCSSSST